MQKKKYLKENYINSSKETIGTIRREVTYKQKKVLEYIYKFWKEKKYTPTAYEVKAFFGYNKVRAAQDHIYSLLRKGMLYCPYKKTVSRNLAITNKGFDFLKVIEIYSINNEKIKFHIIDNIKDFLNRNINKKDVFFDVKIFNDRIKELKNKYEFFIYVYKGLTNKKQGVYTDDKLLIKIQNKPENGEMVLVQYDEKVKIVKYYNEGDSVEIFDIETNKKEKIDIEEIIEGDFIIYGVVEGIIRSFI